MTHDELRELQVLASRANYLAQLRDRRRLTEDEYVERLNGLREQCGLAPLQASQAHQDALRKAGPHGVTGHHQKLV